VLGVKYLGFPQSPQGTQRKNNLDNLGVKYFVNYKNLTYE